MHLALLKNIRKFIDLSDDDESLFLNLPIVKVKKKQHLLEEGEICKNLYFIVDGCFHIYIVNDKGKEQTLQFGIENWWITDYMSFENQKPSSFFIQAIENAEVIVIDKNKLEELFSSIPKLERYFRIVLQRSFAASQMRIKYLFTMSAEQRYNHFNSNFPEFIQRVPQYMLASYLDFSPEFLSKIRAGKV